MAIMIYAGEDPAHKIDMINTALTPYKTKYTVCTIVRNIMIICCVPILVTAIKTQNVYVILTTIVTAVIAIMTHVLSKHMKNKIDDLDDDLKFEMDRIERERERKLKECSGTLEMLMALESKMSQDLIGPQDRVGIALRTKRFESYWQMEKYIENMHRNIERVVADETDMFKKMLEKKIRKDTQKTYFKRELENILKADTECYSDKGYARTYERMKNELVKKIKSAVVEDKEEKPLLILRCTCKAGNDMYEHYENLYAKDVSDILSKIERCEAEKVRITA